MSERIDWVGIMVSLDVPTSTTYYYGLEVGPAFRVPDVVAIARRFGARLSPEAIAKALDDLVDVSVLTREGDLYTVTPGAAEHTAWAAYHGCDDEGWEAVPQWLKAIVESDGEVSDE